MRFLTHSQTVLALFCVHSHVAIRHTCVPVTPSLIQTHLHLCLPTEVFTLHLYPTDPDGLSLSAFPWAVSNPQLPDCRWPGPSSYSSLLWSPSFPSIIPQHFTSFEACSHQLASICVCLLPCPGLLCFQPWKTGFNCCSSGPGLSPSWVINSLLQFWQERLGTCLRQCLCRWEHLSYVKVS